ncbi:MAG: hypothetical protein Q4B48_01200 [Syntrophomonadaceae bacterium]|nr:hypothetical protein [Syntrophomonadaceae bacterium]
MIQSAIGKQRLMRQKRHRILSRILAVFCLLLAVAGLVLLTGWYKAAAVLAVPLAIIIEMRGSKAYDRVFFAEREKERLAQYLRRSLPECRVEVNQRLEEQVADLIVVGPPGIFVICITELSYDCIDENVDRRGLEIQALAQRVCPGYPVEALIFARQMSMLKPAVTRLTPVHSPGGIVDCVSRSRQRCTEDEIERIAFLLGWEAE